MPLNESTPHENILRTPLIASIAEATDQNISCGSNSEKISKF